VITAVLLEENRTRCIAPLPEAEVRRVAHSVGRYAPGPRGHIMGFDLADLPQTIDTLNCVPLLKGRITFVWLRRRGSIIHARFSNGREARWNSATDLRTFARSQDILLDATGVLIPTPTTRALKPTWEPVAQLIRHLADQDATNMEPFLKDEFDQIIRATWVRAGRPQVVDREGFFRMLRECQNHRRDNAAEKPPQCCVWVGGVGEASSHCCWIYRGLH
jgi:hypothetical protein